MIQILNPKIKILVAFISFKSYPITYISLVKASAKALRIDGDNLWEETKGIRAP